MTEVINQFQQDIDPTKTRIGGLPSLILVFGGKKSIAAGEEYCSLRNVFLRSVYGSGNAIAENLYVPEDFQEWNRFEGYSNLIEFERDAVSLSRGIVVFSESAGSFAELGAFCMDDVLSERMMVVVQRHFYDATSFIKLGPIKKIEEVHSNDAVYVIDSKDPKAFEEEVQGVVDALNERIQSAPKTQQFDSNRTRDQLLLIADLVELFGALSLTEIQQLLNLFTRVEVNPSAVKRMLGQLSLFDLIKSVRQSNRHYYVPPKERQVYLDYEGLEGRSKFNRLRIKTTSFEFLKKDSVRLRAYEQIHGEVQS